MLINSRLKDEYYRQYVAEGIRIISENTAKYAGGSYLTARYKFDRVGKREEMTSEEAVERMKKRLGGWRK